MDNLNDRVHGAGESPQIDYDVERAITWNGLNGGANWKAPISHGLAATE